MTWGGGRDSRLDNVVVSNKDQGPAVGRWLDGIQPKPLDAVPILDWIVKGDIQAQFVTILCTSAAMAGAARPAPEGSRCL